MIQRMPRFAALSAATALSMFAAQPSTAFEWPQWQSRHGAGNPLAGTIVDAEASPVDMAAFEAAVGEADYVLIGEIHDNPDHHQLQARIIRDLVEAGRRPAVVFEMIPEGLGDELEAFLRSENPDAERLGAVLRWSERGWPDWPIYRPIAEAALDAGLPILPGDLDRETIRRIGEEGEAALTQEERARLGLDRPMDAAAEAELGETIRTAHCGLMPDAAIAPMQTVQRARDGALADAAMRAAAAGDGAVLIAGSGHVRADRAVPALIRAREPQAKIVAIQLAEVSEGETEPAGYGLSGDGAPYDFTLFTPRADITDHCAVLRERMMKGSGGN